MAKGRYGSPSIYFPCSCPCSSCWQDWKVTAVSTSLTLFFWLVCPKSWPGCVCPTIPSIPHALSLVCFPSSSLFRSGFSLLGRPGTLFSPGCQCLIQTFGSESLSPRRFSLSSQFASYHIIPLCSGLSLFSLWLLPRLCLCGLCFFGISTAVESLCLRTYLKWAALHTQTHIYSRFQIIHYCVYIPCTHVHL